MELGSLGRMDPSSYPAKASVKLTGPALFLLQPLVPLLLNAASPAFLPASLRSPSASRSSGMTVGSVCSKRGNHAPLNAEAACSSPMLEAWTSGPGFAFFCGRYAGRLQRWIASGAVGGANCHARMKCERDIRSLRVKGIAPIPLEAEASYIQNGIR